MTATLCLFDLDHTLLAGDSDYEWGQFLVDRGVLAREEYEAQNAAFFEQYKAGTLDIHEYLGFALRPLAFRMDSLHLDPLAGVFPGADEWGFRFDFELGFGELPESMPAALRNLRLSILDAGFSGGRLTGTIEPRELTSPIPLALGDAAGCIYS